MNTILIRQPAGLGDILWTLKIGLELYKKYQPKELIWPVWDAYSVIKDYIDVPINFQFVKDTSNFSLKDVYTAPYQQIIKTNKIIYVPLEYACEHVLGSFNFQENLYTKYQFANLGFDGWSSYVKIKRNRQKEEELYNKVVKTKPYILVNRQYGLLNPVKREDMVYPDKSVVEMDFIEGYCLFDWIKVIENAAEVHTLQTSLAYLLDIMQYKNVYIYHRIRNKQEVQIDENTFYYCKRIHNPNWIYESPSL